MKLKKLVVLILIFLVLAGAVLVKKAGLISPPSDKNAVLAPVMLLDSSFSKSGVKKMLIRQPGQPEIILLRTSDADWKVESAYGVPARKGAVENLLQQLVDIRGELLSDKADVLADFGLKDDMAMTLRLEDANATVLQEVFVSLQRPGGTKNFVRKGGSNEVLVTDEDVLTTFNIFSKDDKIHSRLFTDLRPAGIEVSKVRRLEVTPAGGKTLNFEKKEGVDGAASTWLLKEDPAQIDTQKINEFLSALYNLYASDMADPALFAKDNAGQIPWIRLEWKDGDKTELFSLSVGPLDDAKKARLVKTEPGNFVYELPDAQLDVLLKKTKDSFTQQKGA